MPIIKYTHMHRENGIILQQAFFFFLQYIQTTTRTIFILKQPFKPGSSSFDLIFLILTVFPLKVDNINLCLK